MNGSLRCMHRLDVLGVCHLPHLGTCSLGADGAVTWLCRIYLYIIARKFETRKSEHTRRVVKPFKVRSFTAYTAGSLVGICSLVVPISDPLYSSCVCKPKTWS